jgi:hypothetical protein
MTGCVFATLTVAVAVNEPGLVYGVRVVVAVLVCPEPPILVAVTVKVVDVPYVNPVEEV